MTNNIKSLVSSQRKVLQSYDEEISFPYPEHWTELTISLNYGDIIHLFNFHHDDAVLQKETWKDVTADQRNGKKTYNDNNTIWAEQLEDRLIIHYYNEAIDLNSLFEAKFYYYFQAEQGE